MHLVGISYQTEEAVETKESSGFPYLYHALEVVCHACKKSQEALASVTEAVFHRAEALGCLGTLLHR